MLDMASKINDHDLIIEIIGTTVTIGTAVTTETVVIIEIIEKDHHPIHLHIHHNHIVEDSDQEAAQTIGSVAVAGSHEVAAVVVAAAVAVAVVAAAGGTGNHILEDTAVEVVEILEVAIVAAAGEVVAAVAVAVTEVAEVVEVIQDVVAMTAIAPVEIRTAVRVLVVKEVGEITTKEMEPHLVM